MGFLVGRFRGWFGGFALHGLFFVLARGRDFWRLGHAGAVSFKKSHIGRSGHRWRFLHEAEGDGDRNGAWGVVPNETGEFGTVGALLLGLDKFRRRVHLAREACRVFVVCASDEFYGCARVQGRPHLRGELVEVLVGDRDADMIFPALIKELGRFLIEVFLRLVKVEVKGRPLLG